MKAATLLMCSGGLRVGALESLLISHLERKGDVYKVNVYKGLKGRANILRSALPNVRKRLILILSLEKDVVKK